MNKRCKFCGTKSKTPFCSNSCIMGYQRAYIKRLRKAIKDSYRRY